MEDWRSKYPNIALNKSTKQSSILGYAAKKFWTPNFANDGNTLQHNPGPRPPGDLYGICAHTHEPPKLKEWWAVDRSGIFDIFGIIIYGRDDCCSYRFRDFDVDVIAPMSLSEVLTFDTMNNGYITYNLYESQNTVKRIIDCPRNTSGQIIRVRHRGKRVLTLCEVQVFCELSCLSAASVSRHMGFVHRKYQGTVTGSFYAVSRIECIAFCKVLPCTYAVNFYTKTKKCVCTEQSDPAIRNRFISTKGWLAFLLS